MLKKYLREKLRFIVKGGENLAEQEKTVSTQPTQQKIGKFIVQEGVAIDVETGLMWLRFAYGQEWRNEMAIGSAMPLTWNSAIKQVRYFKDHYFMLDYAEYKDWRIPTIDELKTLVNNQESRIDNDVFPNNPAYSWSSSSTSDGAYYMIFSSGKSSTSHKNDLNAIRLVRKITALEKLAIERKIEAERQAKLEIEQKAEQERQKTIEIERKIEAEHQAKLEVGHQVKTEQKAKIEAFQRIGKFIVQDGIAIDTETGLMWLRFSYGQDWDNGKVVGKKQTTICDGETTILKSFNQTGKQKVGWNDMVKNSPVSVIEAKPIQKFISYFGYTDWRIPRIDELETLIDKQKGLQGNYIDTDVFCDDDNSNLYWKWYWSSTASVVNNNYAFVVNFYNGNFTQCIKTSDYFLRFVRSLTSEELDQLNLFLEKEKIEIERQAKLEAGRKAEQERQEKLEIERKAESERQAKLEAERKAEQERQEKLAIERKIEAERQAKLEAEQKAEQERQENLAVLHLLLIEIKKIKIEAERQAKLEAEQKAKQERQEKADAQSRLHSLLIKIKGLKSEQERQAKLEIERKIEVKQKIDTNEKIPQRKLDKDERKKWKNICKDIDKKIEEEKIKKHKEEQGKIAAVMEELAIMDAKKAARDLNKIEAERQAKLEAERRAEQARQEKLEIERKIEAERQAKLEAERKAEQERQEKLEIERKAESERQAKLEAEQKAEQERQEKLAIERKIEAERQAKLEAEQKAEQERQEKLAIERKIEAERQAKLEAEQKAEQERQEKSELERKINIERKEKTEALQKIDSAKQARIKAEEQTEIERKAKIEAQRKAETARQEKLEAERTIESEKLKNEQLKTAHAQQFELEKARLKREFELEIEKLKIESEQKIKLEIERLKAETIKTTEIIETETILEVVTVEVETEKPKISVPLLKDEATQDFEDMF